MMASPGAAKLSLAWDSFDQSIRDNLRRLRGASEFSDVSLVTREEGPSLPAHRLVLAGASPVFRRILQVRDVYGIEKPTRIHFTFILKVLQISVLTS